MAEELKKDLEATQAEEKKEEKPVESVGFCNNNCSCCPHPCHF